MEDATELLTKILEKLTSIDDHLETISGDSDELATNSRDHRLGKSPYTSLRDRK